MRNNSAAFTRSVYVFQVELVPYPYPDVYVTDANHSLSIGGYRVTPDLIERGRSGRWNPDLEDEDKTHRNALAARGYPWTVIPLESRTEYMGALEQASLKADIIPFTKFLAKLVSSGLAGESLPEVPRS